MAMLQPLSTVSAARGGTSPTDRRRAQVSMSSSRAPARGTAFDPFHVETDMPPRPELTHEQDRPFSSEQRGS
jgi:hypothetical protein